jgi:uncharacterized radical SAM superfamily Fe-S cluster-containing enzyme
MNSSFCNTCKALVPSASTERAGKVFLIKNCPKCGTTETLASSDAKRYKEKQCLDGGFEHQVCKLNCLHCDHRQPLNLIFVDITNRCNLNCPICINNTPSMGFLFEPPLDYFDKIFKHISTFEPRPAINIFGGEPTVRNDLFDIIKMVKSYGLTPRVVTNGLKLADEEYCRKLIGTGATILIAYDGANPETYRILRGSAKALELKQKALENIRKIGGAKVGLMTLAAKGFNDHELRDLVGFCHDRREFIRAIYFMPLAHSWNSQDFDLEPERMTTEDVEDIVAAAYPEEKIEFLPAGFLGELRALTTCLRIKPLPLLGAHPNCESLYLLISDGKGYVPLSRYLKGSAFDVAQALREADRRLQKHLPPNGKPNGWKSKLLFLRAILTAAQEVRPHVRIGQLIKGRGMAKLYHALAVPLGFLMGYRSRKIYDRHTNIQGALQLIVLPFEDRNNVESHRMERCPNAFAYYDPKKDRVGTVPTCAWAVFLKTEVMRGIAEYYGTASLPVTESRPREESLQGV